MIGVPHKITTVDKFQGQQNDYILLSLVRTYNVGHLRDVRRLVVAMSRARLGLYVFARVNLFKNCFELQPTFNILTKRPLQLHLCPNEVTTTICAKHAYKKKARYFRNGFFFLTFRCTRPTGRPTCQLPTR